jgi:phosphohistidine phosphatase
MKTLYIIRHAKSSWDNADQGDFERPLNERGKRDAPRMGKRLKEKGITPDLMITSSAKRAFSTCRRIAEILGYDEEKIKSDRKLYHADEEEILKMIKNLNDKFDSVMIFGHNPGLTNFVNTFTDDHTGINNIPTCGAVAFSVEVDSWKDIDWGKGKLIFFDYPKSKED